MIASLKFLTGLFLRLSYAFAVALGLCGGLASLCIVAITGEGGFVSALLIAASVAVVGGLLFGAQMALLLGGHQILAVWRRGFPLTDETLAVSHRRQLTIELPFAETFTLCTASIRYLGKADVEEETDYATGVILAVRRWTMKSWGERIRFELRRCEGGTAVAIECGPLRRGALVDGGSSLEHLDAIIGFLLAHGLNGEDVPAAAGPAGIQENASHEKGFQGSGPRSGVQAGIDPEDTTHLPN